MTDFFKTVQNMQELLHLDVTHMALLLGISRQSYYDWRDGASPTEKRKQDTGVLMKSALDVIQSGHWPPEDIGSYNMKQRYERISLLMREDE